MIYLSIIARIWLGSMFLYAAGLKLVWYDQNGCHVKAYQLLPESFAPTVGSILIFAELIAGISLLTEWFFPLGLVLAIVLGATFGYASLRVLLRKADIPCGCAGKTKSRVNWTSLIRASFIVIVSIFLLIVDQAGGFVLSQTLILLVIVFSLLPAAFVLRTRIGFARLNLRHIKQEEDEIARVIRLLGTQPTQ